MGHPKENQVKELHRQGLSVREITQKTGVPKSTVHRIVTGSDEPTIAAKGEQWTVKLNPWIKLIHEAAMEQIPGCRSVSLDDFIYYCCDYVKCVFKLHPPGWAEEQEPKLDLTEPPGWDTPQVKAAAAMLEREAALWANFRGHV